MKLVQLCTALTLGLVLLGGWGCNKQTTAGNAQTASEIDVIKEGLEAWKSGATQASLESRPTPLQFIDPDWKAGVKLVDYRMVKLAPEEEGVTVCTFELTLELKGKSVTRQVNYQVVMTPKRVVSRYPR